MRYSSEPMFALNVRMLIALAFDPACDIPDEFSKLCGLEIWTPNDDDEDSPKLENFLNYFERTYIGIQTRTQAKRRRAMFPPGLWSVFIPTKIGEIFENSQ